MKEKTDAEWRVFLTPEQYHICREAATEPPFSGPLLHNKAKGNYLCVCCGSTLFESDTKFDSGSGWPSFWQAAIKDAVIERQDNSNGMKRREIVCAQCHAHLGHVFEDGPKPTGLRYCVNSVGLKFIGGSEKQKTEG